MPRRAAGGSSGCLRLRLRDQPRGGGEVGNVAPATRKIVAELRREVRQARTEQAARRVRDVDLEASDEQLQRQLQALGYIDE